MTPRHRLAQIAGFGVALVAIAFVRQPASLGAHSADPTFAEDVAPILYKNCATCHRPGGIGPFSVLDYDSVKSEADEIREKVSLRQMPPWHAEGPHGVFRNDRRLNESERGTILRWLDAGAKAGDLSKLPPKPTFPDTWSIGTPDLIVPMPESYTVPASGKVDYQYFQVTVPITEDKWVQAFEVIPGAREVVHHVLVYARVPAAPRVPGAPAPLPAPIVRNRAQSETPPDPPRDDSTHAPRGPLGALIGGIAPGTEATVLPPGTALRLRAGTVLTFQMHYTAHGHAMTDRSMIGFKFAKEMPEEEVFASSFINGSFKLPAGAKDVAVPSEIGAREPVKIYGLLPHTHLRGTRWQYKLVNADSTSEVILDVPHYDFNWQTYYMFAKPLVMPAGSKIVATAWYDNSSSNKSNPDPTKDVWWGDQTWEEMQYTGFLYSIPSRRLKPASGQQ